MRFEYQNVGSGSDNDGQKRNELNWFCIRGDLDDYRWTFAKNTFCTFSSNFNFFVSWETVHILCVFEFAFVQKHTASFWRSFKL